MDPRTHLPPDCPPLIATYRVDVPVASVRRRASARSPQDTQLLHGQIFNAYKVNRGWAWGQSESPIKNSAYPGYIGYVRVKDLAETGKMPTHVIAQFKAPVFRIGDIKSQIFSLHHMGAQISGVMAGNFLRTEKGYIHKHHVRALNEASQQTDYVCVVEKFLGLPYIWGGMTSDGLDCSGLVLAGLRAVGRDGPRDSDMQAMLGREIEDNESLTRGDLIFWRGHVGIMQDKDTLLHANAYHMCVASELLSEAVARIKKTTGPVTARRRII